MAGGSSPRRRSSSSTRPIQAAIVGVDGPGDPLDHVVGQGLRSGQQRLGRERPAGVADP
jgi:hypothetical protein